MSNHTPSQRKRFDDIYELYHFNPFHDPRNGQFTSSRGGSRGRRKYINPDGTFTEKGRTKIKTTPYESEAERTEYFSGGGIHGKFVRPESSGGNSGKKKNKKNKSSNESDNSNNSNNSNNNNNNNNDQAIRVDGHGRIHPDDLAAANSKVESLLSNDSRNKASALSSASNLLKGLARFNQENRNRTAKAKAAGEKLTNMSNEELKRYIDERSERMGLERRYREIREAEYNRGRAKLDDMLETTGTILALGATAATIAATIHTLRS
jgi:hypothetical protein